MKVTEIHSNDELQQALTAYDQTYLLLYKSKADQADCGKSNLEKVQLDEKGMHVLAADVASVRDIHGNYGIKSVPVLIEFKGQQLRNVAKGCQDESYYKSYFENIIYEQKVKDNPKPARRVTVYTTPTCPWCTTVKNFLRKNGISYTEVDVAGDQQAAQAMVSKSGQQGVPQTEINGEMVIGFDQAKLNRLLELK